MREILFRGKRKDNGEWVEGCFGRHTSLDAFIIDRPYPTLIGDWSAFGFYEVDPATVGQFTGLTDKNGERIFEGDIVKFRTRTSVFNKPLYVRWYGETAQFLVSLRDGVRSYPMDKSWEYEVIGNIHDNPELLNGGDAG